MGLMQSIDFVIPSLLDYADFCYSFHSQNSMHAIHVHIVLFDLLPGTLLLNM